MQQKIHMQDQINNRIDMIMDDQREGFKQVIEDLAIFGLIVTVLGVGIVW